MLPRVVVLRIHAQHTLRQAQLVRRIIQPFDYHAPVMPDLVVLRIIGDHIIDVLKLLLQITAKRLEDIPPELQIRTYNYDRYNNEDTFAFTDIATRCSWRHSVEGHRASAPRHELTSQRRQEWHGSNRRHL